jgi:ABC-type antimicrobial peptide transport system permease subunit
LYSYIAFLRKFIKFYLRSISNIGLTGKDSKDDVYANMKRIDANYLDVYGLKLVAGKNILPTDTLNEVLINETLARQLGFKTPEEALDKLLKFGKSPKPIVGVVKDFHVNSLHKGIDPVYMGAGIHRYETAGVKFSTKNPKEMMHKIEKLWLSIFPEYVFEYQFFDEALSQFYEGEKQLSNLFKIFAFIAIFIGCIGLYGLVSFMATQKNKEIGIRKVMGASVGQIVYLFSKEFAMLLLIAFAIALPIVYYVMNSWLADFAYRVSIGWQVFVISIVSSALIACFTVGYKSLKAALMNPVKSLRSE